VGCGSFGNVRKAVPVTSQEILFLDVINDAHLDYNHLIQVWNVLFPLSIMMRCYGLFWLLDHSFQSGQRLVNLSAHTILN
jgi:hypothetical protein